MAKLKIRGKELRKLGYPQGPAIGLAINLAHQHCKRQKKEEVLAQLAAVLAAPEDFLEDPAFGKLAAELLPPDPADQPVLAEAPLPYETFGLPGIERSTLEQMNVAARLPVAIGAALMPDAHLGYGLPIGGVLATENAVIPYGVGMDIGCRMALSIYPLAPDFLEKNRTRLTSLLQAHTAFGPQELDRPADDPVLERAAFREIPKLKTLHHKAARQIGSSGSGNHFVEFGLVELTDPDNEFGLPVGQYVALLSHSGSRGLGANIAQHYTKIAMEKCPLPKQARHLAWLDLDTEAGQEYWLAMNLAGDYASACHRHIHERLARALATEPAARVENHHNFAWKETLPDGREVIVHRKGATPAGEGVLGVIPGSMVHPGFIVRGKGSPLALNSAAHGAGRVMSRRQAKNSTTRHELEKTLRQHGVDLIGGGLDEAPLAYKNIQEVMAFQSDLVEVVGTFLPKIVRMDA